MLNWVGNKQKYFSIIELFVKDFQTVVDPMMGSGNVLIQLSSKHNIIGCDIVKLLPIIYQKINGFDISLKMMNSIIKTNNDFKNKNDYYNFRDHWNEKYINDIFDDKFLIETFLLLKMCSNSMVRFNKKGYFNQGFRGTNNEGFFYKSNLRKFIDQLKFIKYNLSLNKNLFLVMDVIDFLENYDFEKEHIFIFDPPYLLTDGFYSQEYNFEKEQKLFNFINNSGIKFLLFNFIERNEIMHDNLKDFIKANNFNISFLNDKSMTGQNRKGKSEVKEVLITNLKGL